MDVRECLRLPTYSKLLAPTPPTRLCRATSPHRGGLGSFDSLKPPATFAGGFFASKWNRKKLCDISCREQLWLFRRAHLRCAARLGEEGCGANSPEHLWRWQMILRNGHNRSLRNVGLAEFNTIVHHPGRTTRVLLDFRLAPCRTAWPPALPK